MWLKIGSSWSLNDRSRFFSFTKHLNSSISPDSSVISCDLCLREMQSMQITTSHVLQYAEQLCFGCASQKHKSFSSLLESKYWKHWKPGFNLSYTQQLVVIEILSTQNLVYRPTNRWNNQKTFAKQYAPFFQEGPENCLPTFHFSKAH